MAEAPPEDETVAFETHAQSSASQPSGVVTVIALDCILEIDCEAGTVTRVTGTNPPSKRLKVDGLVQPFKRLFIEHAVSGHTVVERPIPGFECFINWDGDRHTRVATVVAVIDGPGKAWGRSFFLQDPEPGAKHGVVTAAGQPVLGCPTLDGAFVAAALLTVGANATGNATSAAFGLMTATDKITQHFWSAYDSAPQLADPGPDGWRRPWAPPPGLQVGTDTPQAPRPVTPR